MNQHDKKGEYYWIIYMEKVGGGNRALSTKVGNEPPFSISCDKGCREGVAFTMEEHNSKYEIILAKD